MVLAIVAWFVRRSAHVISLILIFNVGMKGGLLHAIYSEYCCSSISVTCSIMCDDNCAVFMESLVLK